jgi:hypothetical protein
MTFKAGQNAKPHRDKRVRQSVCATCNKTAGPGTAVVLHFGAGGRVHKTCLAKEQKHDGASRGRREAEGAGIAV